MMMHSMLVRLQVIVGYYFRKFSLYKARNLRMIGVKVELMYPRSSGGYGGEEK